MEESPKLSEKIPPLMTRQAVVAAPLQASGHPFAEHPLAESSRPAMAPAPLAVAA